MHHFVTILRSLVLALAIVGFPAVARDIVIETEPLPLNPRDPEQMSVGSLTYLGGLVLESKEWRFGGISGLAVSADGTQMLAITDRASWIAFRPVLKDGRLVGVTDGKVRFMRNHDAGKWSREASDSEGLAITADGTAYVSFERDHRIVRYLPSDPQEITSLMKRKAQPGPEIALLKEAPDNSGLESLVALTPGRLLAVTEDGRTPDGHVIGWLIGGDHALPLAYRTSDSFLPTDMARLPDGDVLTVERRFTVLSGAAARLCIIEAEAIAPLTLLECNPIAELIPPLTVDNMEALAAYENAAGETIVFVMSDDNFNWVQDTLLMMFRLEREPPEAN